MQTNEKKADISLRVPGKMEYALVIRTALGGVAILKDLNVDMLDDLRIAADEACDCLLHQGRKAEMLQLCVQEGEGGLTVSLEAEFSGECEAECADQTAVSQAILETLIPQVELHTGPCGCVRRIDLTMPKAV